jgi:hypothetical protein
MQISRHLVRHVRRLVPLATVLLAGSPAWAADCAPRGLPPYDAAGKGGWAHVPLSKLKRDTKYAPGTEDGRSILKATAEDAASAFVHLEPSDPAKLPILEWSWRVPALIEKADNRDPKKEDSPARLIVGFDGDKSTLSDAEQRRLALAKKASGRDVPFATLMYIWSNREPVGTVIPSAHSERLKMIVVESGAGGTGAWRSYRRNLAEDYRLAYGTAPGPMLGVAVMTDTDNTNAKAEGHYGPIRLACPAPAGK